MKKRILLLGLLLALAASCGSDPKTTIDAPPAIDANVAPECFMGTPTKHDDLINACVDQSVTKIVKYPTLTTELAALPLLNSDGSTPILP
jgi:hypothetical protein